MKRHSLPTIPILVISLVLGFSLGSLFIQADYLHRLLPILSRPASQAEVVKVAAYPSKLSIPALSLEADVEVVGLDGEGRMATPQDSDDVAWYRYSATPGQPGHTVIAGHVDSETGPAVFAGLSQLTVGDTVTIQTTDGPFVRYHVIDQATYATETFPLATIFGSADKPRLILITCGGRFKETTREYSHRIVVTADLATEY